MRGFAWSLTAGLLIAIGALAVACQTVPITGRSQLNLVSPTQEIQMGAQAYQSILKKAKVTADPTQNALVTRVGRRIAAATGRTDLPWEFKVIDDSQTVNAFALPGGKVAVYTGILPMTRDEVGLAAVLGHEVSHVIARHSAERMSHQLALDLLAAGLGAATGSQMVQRGSAILENLVLLKWGRREESEADHLGLIYMAKAGYDPHAARELWVRMADAAKGRARQPEFLSTHPSDETRIRQIEEWLPEAMQHYQSTR